MIKNINKIFEPVKTVELNYVSGDFFPHVEIREGVVYYDEEDEIYFTGSQRPTVKPLGRL